MHTTKFSHNEQTFSFFHYDPEREHISRDISNNLRFYEQGTLDYIAKNIEPGGTWVDVGACIGTHTVFFATFMADRVIAIEPALANYRLLTRNIRNNRLWGKVQAWHCGISRDGRHIRYTVPDNNAGAVRVNEKGVNIAETRTPETIIFNPIRFIKIDCEDMTGEVLEAFMPIIRKYHPYVLIEADSPPPGLLKEGYKEIENFRTGTKVYLMGHENS